MERIYCVGTIREIQRRFDIALEPNNFFGIVKNYCLSCEFFTMDNDKYCEKNIDRPDAEKCKIFECRYMLEEALNG